MLRWLLLHTAGWQVLVPALIAFCIGGVLSTRRGERCPPLTFGAVWLVSLVAIYLLAGIGRYATVSPIRWSAMVAMAALGVAIPIGTAYVGSELLRRAGAVARWFGALAVGLAAVPVTSLVAGFIGDRVLPLLHRYGA